MPRRAAAGSFFRNDIERKRYGAPANASASVPELDAMILAARETRPTNDLSGTRNAPNGCQSSRVDATASVSYCSLVSAGEWQAALPAPAPTPPSAAPSALVAHELYDQQEQQRADRGVDDRPDKARAKVDAELRQQPGADERSDDSDDEVADHPEADATHDLSGQPSRYEADHENDDETFARHDNHPSFSSACPGEVAPVCSPRCARRSGPTRTRAN